MTEFVEVYVADSEPVTARGMTCAVERMDALLRSIADRVFDREGREIARRLLTEAATTEFATERVTAILQSDPPVEDWRAGEGLAEVYLEEEHRCRFPWPTLRDLRNWRASGAGADLVGFHATDSGLRLAFGEVKTSTEARWPPGVASSRSGGLVHQLEELRGSEGTQQTLLRYLAVRADGAEWQGDFQEAAGRYLEDPRNLSLFGVLVRDVEPRSDDLASRAQSLATGVSEHTSIYLAAIYLPLATIPDLPGELLPYGAAP